MLCRAKLTEQLMSEVPPERLMWQGHTHLVLRVESEGHTPVWSSVECCAERCQEVCARRHANLHAHQKSIRYWNPCLLSESGRFLVQIHVDAFQICTGGSVLKQIMTKTSCHEVCSRRHRNLHGTVFDLRTTASQNRVAVPRRARI